MTVKLPIFVFVALISAAIGGAITYVVVPKDDPEMRALVERQIELAEREAAERERAREAAKEWSQPTGIEPGAGQDFRPEW
jgi:DNA-binding NtrC family response regulator